MMRLEKCDRGSRYLYDNNFKCILKIYAIYRRYILSCESKDTSAAGLGVAEYPHV